MRKLTLRARLLLLVLAGVLPFLGFHLASIYRGVQEDRTKVGQHGLDLSRVLAKAVEAELRTRIATLEVLALSRALAADDLPAFRRQAEAVLARQLPGADIVLVQADGRHIMNTAVAPGDPLPTRRELDNQRKVFATGRPSVSNLFIGQAVPRPVVAIDVPVFAPDGTVRLVLALNPTLDAFAAVIRRQRPDAGLVAAVLDEAGVRVARVPSPQGLVGQSAPEEFLALRASQAEGLIDLVSPEGQSLLVAYCQLQEFGWTVAVGTPKAEYIGPAWRHALTSLAVGLCLMLLGLALSQLVARSVIEPLAVLRRLAERDEAVDPAPVVTGLREVDGVAQALVEESRRRRAAMGSLLHSERRLRLVVAELNHRAKNALATVQALALQTARGESDPARFTTIFTARLRSLARAHDLLTAFSWEAAALDAVVRTGLAPWLETPEAQRRVSVDVSCSQDSVPISPGQAQALVLALHELATNAVKYGALSGPEGRVDVSCEAFEEGLGSTILWRESGGPPLVGPPAYRGFGLRLLERALAHDLGPGSSVVVRFPEGGVEATIKVAARAYAVNLEPAA